MDVHEALAARHSVRAFLPAPVPDETLRRVFERAQRAPSWCNIQPWRVWLASGATRERLITTLTAAASSGMPDPDLPWPTDYPPPYDAHRRRCGGALYGAMGIARDDKAGRHDAWMRNYVAFDAPHVAIVGLDRRFGIYAAIDLGCWLQSVLLAALEEGVAACAMASLGAYPGPSREVLGVGEDVAIAFGIALGYEDPEAPANTCRTERDPVETNVRFLG